MQKRIVAPLLSMAVLLLFTGCRNKGSNPTIVFEDSNGDLVAGIGEKQEHKLTWEAADPKIPFFINFAPATFCENAEDGVISSVAGTATCVLTKMDRDTSVSYQVFKQDPRKHSTTDTREPPVIQVFVQHCKGC